MNKLLYFLHGNGQSAACRPDGFLCDDLPGHGDSKWNLEEYNLNYMIKKYVESIPINSTVFAHSFSGHIAINVALLRKDITLICFGMVPLQTPEDIGSLMLVNKEFMNFQQPSRSKSDIMNFIDLSSYSDPEIQKLLYNSAVKQDPEFNYHFFTKGLEGYDWSELDKVQSLKNRFKLILSKNEVFYDFEKASKLPIPLMFDNYKGHSPWLYNHQWCLNVLNG